MKELAQFIKISRIKLGIPQIKFAKQMGVHPSLVSKWELEQRTPTIYELQKMYELFQWNFSAILFPKKTDDPLSLLEARVAALEQQLTSAGKEN
jgi:transcriptional regulator with XRE-family HTH domain